MMGVGLKLNHSTIGVGLNSLFFATVRSLNHGCSFLLGTYHSKNQRQVGGIDDRREELQTGVPHRPAKP